MPTVSVPKHLLCLIGLELMNEPVVAADGHVYEEAQISLWFEWKLSDNFQFTQKKAIHCNAKSKRSRTLTVSNQFGINE